jgi:aspartyl-tRNA(Asn)/glutamyl-tRNA(Gln) amidotransferase subunit B
MKYIPIIGLEIHVELKTSSKMFCRCKNSTDLNVKPNSLICPVCTGMPGSLPAINQDAVEMVIKTGLALNCQVAKETKWDRKNYFYPDLPKGYQISQYDMPLTSDGFLEVEGEKIGIRRVHLEEDTGKLLHIANGKWQMVDNNKPSAISHKPAHSLVDLNRAGVPLMELVTEPDITSARIGAEFAKELQLILRYLEVSDADMEKGQMRVEANVSLCETMLNVNFKRSEKTRFCRQRRQVLQSKMLKLGTKVEIKNLNSFRSVEKAIGYEIERQSKLLDQGEKIVQETRGWDEKAQKTVVQRTKEEAADYRYFPEPDLPPLYPYQLFDIEKLQKQVSHLPAKQRLTLEGYGLKPTEIKIFTSNQKLANYFEKTLDWAKQMAVDIQPQLLANWMIHERLRDKIDSPKMVQFLQLIEKGELSGPLAKQIAGEMIKTGEYAISIIEAKGIKVVRDEEAIEEIVSKIISQNLSAVENYKKGKTGALQFLVGQVMRETKGQAQPEVVLNILKKKII